MWARVVTSQQAKDRLQYPYGTNHARFTVESCCHEEHAWWVVAGPTFLSTWETEDEADTECSRLNELNLSISEATK